MKQLGRQVCFPRAPEICVEVKSPSNTEAEIQEKISLYFDAGAKEVWICGATGAMSFYTPNSPKPLRSSPMCPEFPRQVKLQ